LSGGATEPLFAAPALEMGFPIPAVGFLTAGAGGFFTLCVVALEMDVIVG
jgi:hypothetical protein